MKGKNRGRSRGLKAILHKWMMNMNEHSSIASKARRYLFQFIHTTSAIYGATTSSSLEMKSKAIERRQSLERKHQP